MTHARFYSPAALLILLFAVLAPAESAAQLGVTLYTEYASVEVGDQQETVTGQNDEAEEISASVLGANADISYEATASPAWVRATASIETTEASAAAEATGTINFRFRLNYIINPPVQITSVPMTVTTSGSAAAEHSGLDVSVAVRSEFAMAASASSMFEQREAYVDLVSTASTAAFDEVVPFSITPLDFVTVTMFAQVILLATSEAPGSMTGSGTAYIDPVFRVTDDLIPGTSTRYDEIFEIEFSPGWDGGTGGVPVSSSQSVGQLKARFRN